MFMDSLFNLNQRANLFNSVFKVLQITVGLILLPEINIMVSSTNNIIFNTFEILTTSLNKRGPCIDPCSAPHFMATTFD